MIAIGPMSPSSANLVTKKPKRRRNQRHIIHQKPMLYIRKLEISLPSRRWFMKSTLEVNAEERKFLTIFLVQNGGIRFIIQKFTNEQDLSLLNSIEAISSIQFAIYWNTIKPVKILILCKLRHNCEGQSVKSSTNTCKI